MTTAATDRSAAEHRLEARQRAKTMVVHVGPDPSGNGGMATVSKTLLSSELADRYDLRMVMTHRVGSAAGRIVVFARALIALRRVLRSTDAPRIAHIHTAARGSMYRKALATALARRWGATVILHLHTGAGEIGAFAETLGPLRRAAIARSIKGIGALLSASDAAGVELAQHFGTPPATIVNNPLPGPLPPEPPARSEEPGTTGLLYLGGFENPVKGGDLLIDALALVREHREALDVTLAGPGEPPRAAASVGSWVGWLEGTAKRDALIGADIVVLPSTSEGLPVVLLEAMAYGKAVVATDVGAVPDVVIDGWNGLLVRSGEPESLAAAIMELAGDPEQRARLGRHARLRAADYSTDRVVAQLDAIYQRLLRREEHPDA